MVAPPAGPAAGQEGVTGSPIVASVEARRAISGSGETSGEYEKNTSVEPTRRTTNCASRGYWIAPVPEAR